jgi:hypothetical protein
MTGRSFEGARRAVDARQSAEEVMTTKPNSTAVRIVRIFSGCWLPLALLIAGICAAQETRVDASSLTGKVMCGYQGWFNGEGDGAERGFHHWTKKRGPLAPGNAKIDLWPDVSELGPDERFATEFKHADGRVAEVFSSFKEATVLRHFQWMRDYGIDGVFVQRFIGGLRDPKVRRHNDTVLGHCRTGAERSGRVFAVMYDLTGLGENRIEEVIADWRKLRHEMRVTDDASYLRHRGQPLVAVWGVGFNDDRKYTLAECRRLVEFLKNDGCSVMLGVPVGWRELNRDSTRDPALHDILKLADVISPWSIGRYRDPAEAVRHAEKTGKSDIAWCVREGLDYLPVVFPGFSWHNMHGGPLDAIPRRKGEFLWSQFTAAKRIGATMIYVAMFDEVDEATAIFKCSNDVPVGAPSRFVTYEGLPSDFYLKLTGAGARMLRGELEASDMLPLLTK